MYTHFGNENWHQAAAFALRYEVFVLEQAISLQDEFDQLDTCDQNYFVVYEQSLAVATIRYQTQDNETIQPDRFCVKKAYRGNGIGKMLLLLLEEKAVKEGYSFSCLSAEIEAVSFYEKLGYATSSEEYLEDRVPCIEMRKKLIDL